jgi:hypothetical protein
MTPRADGGYEPCRSIGRIIGKSRQVLCGREPLRLEPPNLARRRSKARGRVAANNPADRRIMAQPLRVVHMLVSGKPPKNGLSQHADQRMPPFLPVQASASLSTGKSERPSGIIKFAVREQSGVRGLDRTAKHEISLRSA